MITTRNTQKKGEEKEKGCSALLSTLRQGRLLVTSVVTFIYNGKKYMGEEKLALNYQIGSYTPARSEKTATLTKCRAVHFSLAILTTCRQRRGPSYLENRQHGGCYAALLLVRDVPIPVHYLKVMTIPFPQLHPPKVMAATQFPATDALPSTSTCGDNAEWPATDVYCCPQERNN